MTSKKSTRRLIEKGEQKVSILQIIGFLLIAIGIIELLGRLFIGKVTPDVMSLNFFIIMLGFAFAFPSLLKGNDGLSTMRMVVFMMSNVICLLLLKIGWADTITSLKCIGLDQYWMGVIAFTFGAKATQSYFESRFAVNSPTKAAPLPIMDFTDAELAKLAVSQNQDMLRIKFKNIASISDSINRNVQPAINVVTLYLVDNITTGIPNTLSVRLPDNTMRTVPTEIITGVGNGQTHFGQLDQVQDANATSGSICCVVSTPATPHALVTSGHVWSDDTTTSANGAITGGAAATVGGAAVGNWIFQLIDDITDVALASITNYNPTPDYISFNGKGHYTVGDDDVSKTQVNLVSTISKSRTGYILDYQTAWNIDYAGVTVLKSNIILIGSTSDKASSQTLSDRGDSGGCVYEPVSGNLVGIIVGGNAKYTWVLPLGDLFTKQKFKLQ